MTDRPMLFSAPMVRALLRGDKTQTRRLVKPQPGEIDKPFMMDDGTWHVTDSQGGHMSPLSINIRKGDRIWVREAWRVNGWATDVATIIYRASENASFTEMSEQFPIAEHAYVAPGQTWRSSLHIPRWASRLTLLVKDVRIERLQDISPEDAGDEGVDRRSKKVRQISLFGATAEERAAIYLSACVWEYADLWNTINGAGSWDANPWVVAYTFSVIKANIDEVRP